MLQNKLQKIYKVLVYTVLQVPPVNSMASRVGRDQIHDEHKNSNW